MHQVILGTNDDVLPIASSDKNVIETLIKIQKLPLKKIY